MKKIRVLSLYSGSTGNAFLIQGPKGSVLIDAGKNAKHLCASLGAAGVEPDEIQAILVTHEHSDHISALPVFLKKCRIPVHLARGCAYRLENEPWAEELLCPHPPICSFEVAGMQVTSFPTPHDSRASVGYRFEIPNGDASFTLGYATDIGYVTPQIVDALTGCDAVILESNHDLDMLEEGPYPYDLKQRILSRRGHLSNPDSALLAARLCASGTKALMLAHLSRENNTPEIAYDDCHSAVGDESIEICVAHPDEITELTLEGIL